MKIKLSKSEQGQLLLKFGSECSSYKEQTTFFLWNHLTFWSKYKPVTRESVVPVEVCNLFTAFIVPKNSNLSWFVPFAPEKALTILVALISDVAANITSKMAPTLPWKNPVNTMVENPSKFCSRKGLKMLFRSSIKPSVSDFVRSL